MPVALYLDVHVHAAVAEQLRRRGIDVLTAQEDGSADLFDDELLIRSATLGRVLFTYDIRFKADGTKRPGFFDAKVTNGVLHCDTDGEGPNGVPPITVQGWSDLEDKS